MKKLYPFIPIVGSLLAIMDPEGTGITNKQVFLLSGAWQGMWIGVVVMLIFGI